ncbi:unnamed protein product [Strongylus vulgaris]|uniref:Uncharacterized protein n=1 Tax=Strongylus vulgaris TaxID=40348 RepID=A0A3P7KC93_STRVU|nr:unnamed protein product [Strongylus vulgaris]
MHQRAQYEILAEVILVTSAIRNSLLENPFSKEKRDELMWGRIQTIEKRRKGLVTTASLRMRKMPEDIPVPELKEKEHSILEEGMDNLKKKVSALGLHHKMQRFRKSSIDTDEVELQTIREEKSTEIRDSSNRVEEVIVEAPTRRRSSSEEMPRHQNIIPNEIRVKNRQDVIEETRRLAKHRNGLTDSSERRRMSSPLIERPSELRGEQRVSSSEDAGAYTVGGLRHMDSGSSTQRSFDF